MSEFATEMRSILTDTKIRLYDKLFLLDSENTDTLKYVVQAILNMGFEINAIAVSLEQAELQLFDGQKAKTSPVPLGTGDMLCELYWKLSGEISKKILIPRRFGRKTQT